MQACLDLIKPHLAAGDSLSLGTVVIGTVEGDMHDIGKNLVAMLLTGAGFKVVNLGKGVTAADFVAAVKEHKPDILGMSGLLTTTIPKMPETIAALKDAGLRDKVKVIVGGAPVSRRVGRRDRRRRLRRQRLARRREVQGARLRLRAAHKAPGPLLPRGSAAPHVNGWPPTAEAGCAPVRRACAASAAGCGSRTRPPVHCLGELVRARRSVEPVNRQPYSGRLHNSGMGLFPLTDDEIGDIYLGALEVLERCGIAVQDERPSTSSRMRAARWIARRAACAWRRRVVEDALRACPSRVRLSWPRSASGI